MTTHAFDTLRLGSLGRYTLPLVGLAALVVLAFAVGRFPVSVGDLFAATIGKLTGTSRPVPATVETVIYQVRGPRVLAALVVGAALATAGAAYQGMFRNPAGLARHPRRVLRRCTRRGACHLPVVGLDRHPGLGVRRRARSGDAGIRDRCVACAGAIRCSR